MEMIHFKAPLKIHLKAGLKIPTGKHWETSSDPQEHARWIQRGDNIGILTGMPNNLTVVDMDSKEAARECFVKHRAILKTIVETRKGAHFYFGGSGPTRKIPNGDLKRDGGYVLYPPSIVDGWQYRFVRGFPWSDELPRLPKDVMPVKKMATAGVTTSIRNVQNYIRGIRSVAGERGHDACFRVACILRDEGLSEAEALAEMVTWNESGVAVPPWSVRDLLKKVRDAFSKSIKGG